MRRLILISALLASACAYNPPAETVISSAEAVMALPINSVWSKTLNELTAAGYPITATSKPDGLIVTGEHYVRLNETQADCGNIWGIPYTKDTRSQTLVSYTVRLTEADGGKTRATISTRVRGTFTPYAGATTQELQCHSLGYLERDLVARITR